jgi:hypothetical protein
LIESDQPLYSIGLAMSSSIAAGDLPIPDDLLDKFAAATSNEVDGDAIANFTALFSPTSGMKSNDVVFIDPTVDFSPSNWAFRDGLIPI